jgi:serine/threonine protein kinase
MTDTASPQPSSPAIPPPPVIAGYRLLNLLGTGGMSAVYLAEQISLGRKVAVKLMAPHVAASPEACDRFVREARAAAAVNHPNVVSIIDVGQAHGQLYMVLELVTGGDAAQLADQHGGKLPEMRALEIAIDCAKGLQALHEANLVHRDLKHPTFSSPAMAPPRSATWVWPAAPTAPIA